MTCARKNKQKTRKSATLSQHLQLDVNLRGKHWDKSINQKIHKVIMRVETNSDDSREEAN